MKIIGLCGYAGVGKDTVAARLCRDHGFTRLAFADALRDMLYGLNPLVPTPEAGYEVMPLQWVVDNDGWDSAKRGIPEVRDLLQRLGHGVRQYDPDYWVTAMSNRLLDLPLDAERVVITDVRYGNEVDFIHAHDGLAVRLEREGVGPVNEHERAHHQVTKVDRTVLLLNAMGASHLDRVMRNVAALIVDYLGDGALP